MYNAFVIFKAKTPGECKNLLEFMCRVVKASTGKRHVGEEEEEAAGLGDGRAPYYYDPESRLDGNIVRHNLEHLTATSRKPRPSGRCRVCARRGQRSETKLWCKSCRVPLHAGESHTAYHTKLHYSV